MAAAGLVPEHGGKALLVGLGGVGIYGLRRLFNHGVALKFAQTERDNAHLRDAQHANNLLETHVGDIVAQVTCPVTAEKVASQVVVNSQFRGVLYQYVLHKKASEMKFDERLLNQRDTVFGSFFESSSQLVLAKAVTQKLLPASCLVRGNSFLMAFPQIVDIVEEVNDKCKHSDGAVAAARRDPLLLATSSVKYYQAPIVGRPGSLLEKQLDSGATDVPFS